MHMNLTTWLSTFAGISGTALCIVALWLATWAFRHFGITSLLWLIAVKASGSIASLAITLPDPKKVQRAYERIQAQFDTSLGDAAASLIYIRPALGLLPPLCLMIIVAGEIGHYGTRLRADYLPSPSVRRCYSWRVVIGILAVFAAIAPSIIIAYVMRSTP
jgi:hypothetical protein